MSLLKSWISVYSKVIPSSSANRDKERLIDKNDTSLVMWPADDQLHTDDGGITASEPWCDRFRNLFRGCCDRSNDSSLANPIYDFGIEESFCSESQEQVALSPVQSWWFNKCSSEFDNESMLSTHCCEVTTEADIHPVPLLDSPTPTGQSQSDNLLNCVKAMSLNQPQV